MAGWVMDVSGGDELWWLSVHQARWAMVAFVDGYRLIDSGNLGSGRFEFVQTDVWLRLQPRIVPECVVFR